MADILKPDLCIIGAGALGIGLAMEARRRGAGVVLVDRGVEEAGDAARGPLHRAAFLASAARAHALRTARSVGLDNAEPKLNFRAIAEHAAAVADAAAPADTPERLAALGVTCLRGKPVFTDRHGLSVGQDTIRAGHIILAMGAKPVVPALPGLDQVPFLTPDTVLDHPRKLSHLVVIGADPAALELAQAYRWLGSDVTIVPQGPVLAGFDPELVAVLLRHLTEAGIVLLAGAEATRIVPRSQGTGVEIRHEGGAEDALDASHILVSLGRAPDLEPDLVDKVRLKRDRSRPDHLLVGRDGRTSSMRISAVGGAAGMHQPHAAARHGQAVLDRLLGGHTRAAAPVPLFVATTPALAQIGSLEIERSRGGGRQILRSALVENDAARAAGAPHGFAKLVLERGGGIAGGAVIGQGAGETIAILAMAMERAIPAAELANLTLPHPSPAAVLVDMGRQALAQRPVGAWARRRAALRRLLP